MSIDEDDEGSHVGCRVFVVGLNDGDVLYLVTLCANDVTFCRVQFSLRSTTTMKLRASAGVRMTASGHTPKNSG